MRTHLSQLRRLGVASIVVLSIFLIWVMLRTGGGQAPPRQADPIPGSAPLEDPILTANAEPSVDGGALRPGAATDAHDCTKVRLRIVTESGTSAGAGRVELHSYATETPFQTRADEQGWFSVSPPYAGSLCSLVPHFGGWHVVDDAAFVVRDGLAIQVGRGCEVWLALDGDSWPVLAGARAIHSNRGAHNETLLTGPKTLLGTQRGGSVVLFSVGGVEPRLDRRSFIIPLEGSVDIPFVPRAPDALAKIEMQAPPGSPQVAQVALLRRSGGGVPLRTTHTVSVVVGAYSFAVPRGRYRYLAVAGDHVAQGSLVSAPVASPITVVRPSWERGVSLEVDAPEGVTWEAVQLCVRPSGWGPEVVPTSAPYMSSRASRRRGHIALEDTRMPQPELAWLRSPSVEGGRASWLVLPPGARLSLWATAPDWVRYIEDITAPARAGMSITVDPPSVLLLNLTPELRELNSECLVRILDAGAQGAEIAQGWTQGGRMTVSGFKPRRAVRIEVSSERGRWIRSWDGSDIAIEIDHLAPINVVAHTVQVVDENGAGLPGLPVNFARVGHQVRVLVTDQRGFAVAWLPEGSECQVCVAGVTHTSDAVLLKGRAPTILSATAACRVQIVNGMSRAFVGRIDLGQSQGGAPNTVYILPGGVRDFRFIRPGPIEISLTEVGGGGRRTSSRNAVVVAGPGETVRHVIQD